MKLTVQFALLLGSLIVLSGTGAAIAIAQLKSADEGKTRAVEEAIEMVQDAEAVGRRARQELSLALGYMRGTATIGDMESARAEFANSMQLASMHAAAGGDRLVVFSGYLENLSLTEAAIFSVSTTSGPRPLWEIVEAQERSASGAFEGTARDAQEIERIERSVDDAEVAEALQRARLGHADAHIALLEYGPSLTKDFASAQSRARTFLSGTQEIAGELTALGTRTANDDLLSLAANVSATRSIASAYFDAAAALHRHAGELLGGRLINLDLLSQATMDLAQDEASEQRATAEHQQRTVQAIIGATVFAMLIPVVAAGVFLVARVRRRLDEFDAASLAVSRGSFDEPPPKRGDDFDNLAVGWSNMVGALRQRDREVAEKNTVLVQNERMASLGSLLAGVAHEVNNPLAFIKSNEEMSVQDLDAVLADPNVVLTNDARMNLDAVRMSLVTNIDGISRVEKINRALKGFAANKPDAREPVDINDVAEGVLIIAHNRLKNRFRITRVFEALPEVRGSPQELGQVILNLVINAADASPPGSTIVVRTQADGDTVRLSVSDEGPGVSPQIRERLFERYATTKSSGTGLGLHISRTIAESHGGTLALADSPKGATFVMSLPIHAKAQGQAQAPVPVIS